MATPSRASGGRSSSRGGRPAAGRSGGGGGGKGNNAMPVAIAVGAVVLVIVLVVVMSGGKKPSLPPPGPAPAPVAAPADPNAGKPKVPERGPQPQLPQSLIQRARALVSTFEEASKKGTDLHKQAMEAKEKGDDAAWQSLMEEARGVLKDARDEWSAIEEEVQSLLDAKPSRGWGVDEVMDVYFRVESSKVSSLLDKPLSGMVKTGRGH